MGHKTYSNAFYKLLSVLSSLRQCFFCLSHHYSNVLYQRMSGLWMCVHVGLCVCVGGGGGCMREREKGGDIVITKHPNGGEKCSVS